MSPIAAAERTRVPGRPPRTRRAGGARRTHAAGATAVELLLALPIVLLLGLGVVQFCLVYQARHALEHALATAARQGAVAHASGDAILGGLAAGLAPYLYGAEDFEGLVAAEARARRHVDLGLASGWIVLRQRSPTLESFDDWAEAARDERGERMPGMIEIPNDNLDNRRVRMQPVSGAAGDRLGEPIGRRSGQSLADANLLRLELAYGLRLAVPVVGRLVLRTLSWWHGCPVEAAVPGGRPGGGPGGGPGLSVGSSGRLGLVKLPLPGAPSVAPHWACGFYQARDGDGTAAGRIPLVASATVRMMSTARLSGLTSSRGTEVASGSTGAPAAPMPTGPDDVDRQFPDQPMSQPGRPTAQPGRQPAAGNDAGNEASGRSPVSFANGFLRIGSDRAFPAPAQHPALCSG